MPTTPESSARAHIRRESLDIYNRLHSIKADVTFVNEVRAAYPSFPFIPNLRCGAWYTDPAIAHPSAHAYFKSTDGHHGNWSFNLRRPNIHLLSIAASNGGLILVDSTRAGKRLPDALSKTVPIWCAVINRAITLRGGCFVDVDAEVPSSPSSLSSDVTTGTDTDTDLDLDLRTPPGAVSPHEHAQIAARLDIWAAALACTHRTRRIHFLNWPRPLRPLWITPASARFPYIAPDASFLPVICVSASRAVDAGTERRMEGFSYVQGSGDDHELWGQGLTPQLFWRHRTELLACSRKDLEAVVVKLVTAARETRQTSGVDGLHGEAWSTLPTPVLKVRGRVLLCTLVDLPRELPVSVPSTCEPDNDGEIETAFIVVYTSNRVTPGGDTDKTSPIEPRSDDRETRANTELELGESEGTSRVLRMHLGPLGKRGQHIFVHDILPRAVSFASSHLSLGRKLCVAGGDEGIGVALILLQLFFDDEGSLRSGSGIITPSGGAGTATATAGKSSVRTRLEWIIASRPQVNPSRTILKRVNDFLLSSHSHHRQDGVEN
ncbi:initiator tRNA phosphoribosyl transferase [Russula emetica]|nr:initiator tRNA phosphoribosyl transferase [Russula emetica]